LANARNTTEEISTGIDCASWRQPLGVFGIITPYNFPVMIPLWFWPYAVATGNTVVLKPSEQDPLTHQRIVELAEEAGLGAALDLEMSPVDPLDPYSFPAAGAPVVPFPDIQSRGPHR